MSELRGLTSFSPGPHPAKYVQHAGHGDRPYDDRHQRGVSIDPTGRHVPNMRACGVLSPLVNLDKPSDVPYGVTPLPYSLSRCPGSASSPIRGARKTRRI